QFPPPIPTGVIDFSYQGMQLGSVRVTGSNTHQETVQLPGGSQVTVTVNQGTATASISSAILPVSPESCSGVVCFPLGETITATYSGDRNYASAQGGIPFGIVVRPAPTQTALTTSIDPNRAFNPLVLNATVGVVSPGNGLRTGTVTFTDGSTVLGA